MSLAILGHLPLIDSNASKNAHILPLSLSVFFQEKMTNPFLVVGKGLEGVVAKRGHLGI